MVKNQNNPQLIFTYGYTASGKTTWSKNFIADRENYYNEKWVYISADEIRKDLYGSQDTYGNPEEIYKTILTLMINTMNQNKNVLYDACNIRYDYRKDYLDFINSSDFDNYYKTIIRFNTDIETCKERHKIRGRNFIFNSEQYKFAIPPSLEEGWDNIEDVSSTLNYYKFYIASPFFEDIQRERAQKVAEFFREKGHVVFLPCEHKVPNAWSIPNYEWGKKVFERDIRALDNSDFLICLSYGRNGSAGTAWELGYAYGIDCKTIVVEMPEAKLMSLMISNGCDTVLKNLDELFNYDFDKFEKRIDREMEQK